MPTTYVNIDIVLNMVYNWLTIAAGAIKVAAQLKKCDTHATHVYQNVGFIHLMKLVAACFGWESKPPTTCEKYYNATVRTSDHICHCRFGNARDIRMI